MGAIYVVRHGQAAFGTDHYDRLTETGFMQSRLLGAYFALRSIRFDAVFTGTLQRQTETAQGIFEAHPELGQNARQERLPGLDEYKPEAILTALTGEFPAPAAAAAQRDPVVVRDHFRLLRQALLAWAEDRTQPEGMADFKAFQEGAVAALVEARERFPDGNVLVVSSGGPIAAMVAAAMQAPPAAAVELNLRIRNSSLTEFASTPRRHHLVSFNGLPHLDTNPDLTLTTYT
ncbi:MAG TPA: histidine phosphatase family protein [Steroidobacteraceae bacterium]|jgi:broad specificity phosphatase PhoE|nr:histidine phosphatase family protein [Steroidobacteraceae bacterium]